MSKKVVDTNVVEMQFDNRNFEKNVATSMSTLDKLKAKLSFKGASDGLDEVGRAAKNVDLSPLQRGAEAVKVKFSTLEVVAMTALSRITNSVISAGEQLVSSFTIDPVKSGLNEYETQINSIQTILANTKSKGSTLDDVNNSLAELNKYADLTIYNFTEMTRNIGTFTAAGVGLKDSTKAIQGIANLAAVSGSNAQQAATAMYQLSQALAAGSVKLQDWNSVVNAGMGGETFQNALKETARAHGVAVDKMIKDAGSFRESLKKGWITSEIMIETLSKMTKTGAAEYLAKLTGISQKEIETQQALVDANKDGTVTYDKLAASMAKTGKITKENAISILEMADTATNAATKVKTFRQLLDTLKEAAQSGWTQTWQLIFGNFEQAKELFTEASDYFGNIISESANKRNNFLTAALSNVVTAKDWKNLQNAGKATKNFESLLIEVAKSHNISVDSMIAAEGSFAKTLKNGWLTADIYKEAIKKTTDAEESLIKKDAESIKSKKEQIEYTKQMTAAMKEADKPYSELMDKMNRPSGRDLLIDSVRNSIKAVATEINGVKKAWSEVFPAASSEQLYNIIDALHSFTEYLTTIDSDGSKLGRTMKGLFSIIHLITTVIGGGFKIGLQVVQAILSHFNLNILDVTAAIGDAIYELDQWIEKNSLISKGVNFTITAIEKGVKSLKAWIAKVKEIPEVQAGLNAAHDAFSSFVLTFSDKLSDAGEKVDGFIERVKQMDGLTLDNILAAFKDFYKNVVTSIFSFKNVTKDANDIFSKTQNTFVERLGKSKEGFDSFKDSVIACFDQIKKKVAGTDILGPLLTIAAGVTIYKTSKKMLGIFEAIGRFAKALKAPLAALTGVLNNTSAALKAYAFSLKAKGIRDVAIAIGILAASLFVLAQCKPKSLFAAAGALAIVSGALAGLCFVLGKFSMVSIGKVSTSMVSIAASLLILVAALKKLETVKMEGIDARLLMLASIAGGLIAFTALYEAVPGAEKSVRSILAFSVSLLLLVSALKKLSKVKFRSIKASIISLVITFAGVWGLCKIINKNKDVALEASKGLVLISVSLLIFVKAIKKICGIDAKEIQNGILGLIVIFGSFIILMRASDEISENAAKAGLMILGISASLLLMAVAIKKISKLSSKETERGVAAISGLLMVFAAVVAMSKFAGEHAAKAGVMVLAMSGTFLAVTVCMAILGRLKDDQVNRALKAIAGISACFALLVASSGLAGNKDIKSNILAFTAAIGAMSVSLGVLSFINPEKLKSATIALTSVMATFALMTASSTFTKGVNIAPILAMSGAVAILGGIITLVGNLPVQNALAAAESLSLLLGVMSASLAVISLVPAIASGSILATLGTMELAVAGIAVILGVMAAMNIAPSIETALSLSTLLLAMSAACVILAGVGTVALPALAGAAALDGVIAIIGGFVLGLGALFSTGIMSKGKEYIEKGFDILSTISHGLGEFVGNLIGGLAEGVMSALPGIGKDLSDFMKKSQGFIDGISKIKPSVAESAKNLASALLIICGANILSAITSWLVGDNDMAAFGGKLKQFAKGLVDFSDTVKGRIDADAVSAAASAGKLITELADSIPNSGGLVGFLVGNNDVDTFGGKLKKFAEGLVDFSSTVKGKIDSESVKTATEAGNLITKLADSVPNSGGLVGFLVGNNDVDKFGGKLKKFAKGLVDFSDTVKGNIDSESVRTATDAGTLVTQLAKTVPKSGGWVEKILGKSDMKEFSDNLKSFGDGLVEFCNSDLQNVKIATMETISRELGSILKLIKNITAFNAVNISAFTTNMEAIAETSIDGFIESFTGSHENVKSAISGFLTTAYNATKAFNLQFITAGSNAAAGFISGIQMKINSGDVYAAGYSIGDTAYKAAKKALDEHSPSKKMKKVGAYAIEGFVKGISNGKVKIAKVTDAVFKKFVASAVSATNVSKYAEGAINKYANSFAKHAGKTKKAMSEAMKTIRAYYTVLYKQSDYYKNDKKNLSDHVKQLRKYYSERTKLSASLSKALAKHDQSNIKNARKSLKENLKNINKLKKQIESDKKKMANNAKKAWNDAKKEIKTAVKEYIDIFNTAADSIDLFSESDMSGATTAISSLKESLQELTSLSNFSLDPGINMLEQFSSAASNSADSVKSATDELADAKEDLASAEKELLEYQTKSLAVNGRSQKYLDKIKELEEKVAEAKKKVASAEETLADASKSSSQEMLDNMKSNVEGYEAWRKDLETLSKSGISDGLISYLKGLGISGAQQVAAFAKMTKEELSQANDYWSKYSSISSKTFTDGLKEKSEAMIKWGEDVEKFANLNIDSNVKAQLLKEFQTQGVDSDEYIRNILSMNASELKDFVDSYSEMMNVPEQVAKKVSESIDAVTKKASSSTDAMTAYIDRMRDNLKAEQDYQENLKKLKSNGISSGLYDQLVSNGDKTLIASFANASKEEIDQANQIFKESAKQSADNWLNEYGDRIADEKTWSNNMKKLTKLNIPKKMKESLYKEFSNKGVEGNDTLELILGMDKDQLKRFVSKYGQGGTETNNIANTILAGAASVSSAAEKEMKNSASKAAASAMKAMNGSVSNSAPAAKKAGKKVGSAAVKGIKTYVNHTKGKSIGKNMTDGMASGLKSGKNKVTSAAIKVAKEAYTGAKNYLKIKSPSRKFKELAMYCVKGMANGLNEYSGLSSDAAVQMSEDMVNRMQSAINAVNMMAQSGVDVQPTIRPVYDMSELEAQASTINDLLGAGSIGVSADMASSVARHMSASMSNQNGVTTNNSYDQSMHASNYNTFNITSNNPKEVANEVSKILQNQVNRRETIWA